MFRASLTPYRTEKELHAAVKASLAAGLGLGEVGAMILRFKVARSIRDGEPVAAARETRSLVRHLRANGLLEVSR